MCLSMCATCHVGDTACKVLVHVCTDALVEQLTGVNRVKHFD